MYRSPQASNQGGRSLPRKNNLPQEKCVGRILKLLTFVPHLENSSLPWCPKLVTGLEVQQTFSLPFSLLRYYQMPECFYVNNCGF